MASASEGSGPVEAMVPALARGLSEPRARPDGDRVMVEFSQPNTHKAFHVGHMRNLCLGDALVRLLRAEGHDVIAANYFGSSRRDCLSRSRASEERVRGVGSLTASG